MDIKETRQSELYNILAWMGLLCTEEKRIRTVRENTTIYEDLDLNYDDIERVGYLYPHVAMNPKYKDKVELWIDDIYLNPKKLTWVETTQFLYAIMDHKYDELKPVKCYYNPAILDRYTNVVEDDAEYSHVVLIDTTDPKYASIDHIEHAAFYISENKVCIPTAEWLDDKTLRFKAPYQHDIDFFICANLVNVVEMTANVGEYIDHPESNHCYHQMIVDHDSKYPIDTRFYPAICVDKDCVIRIYNDNYHTLLYPEVSRLILYLEFLNIDDPYNTDNSYLNTIKPIDVVIKSSDTDEVILDKFNRIVSTTYRLWEKYPINTSEQSDFVICDNAKLASKAFTHMNVSMFEKAGEYIVSSVPCEQFRDVLFYNGSIFHDYFTCKLTKVSDDKYIENQYGELHYLIDPSYDQDKFCLIKFNTDQDTNIMNIGEYIDQKNLAHLHIKLNRFYRNLLVIRQEFLNDKEYVRIASEQPETTDEYLWFELLINAVPEMFETKTIDTINLFGLDPKNIPENIKEGAYKLDLDPENGPASYTELMMTYFKLTKRQKKYLALQIGEGVDDPRIQTFKTIKIGREEDNEELNTMLIEDKNKEDTYTEEAITVGYKDHPDKDDGNYVDGDLYWKDDGTIKVPEGEDNIHIKAISTGPNEPERSEDILWIDNPKQMDTQLPQKDSLDAVTDKITMINDIDTLVEAKKSDYAIDSNEDTFTKEEEGEVSIDDLLGGLEDGDYSGDPDEDDEDEPVSDDLFAGISDAIAQNKTVDDVVDPKYGEIALDNISFCDSETGETIRMEDIAKMDHNVKLAVAGRIITDDDRPENAQFGDMWINYLSQVSEEVLNTIVYKLLLTAQVCKVTNPTKGDLSLEGENFKNTEETLAYGDNYAAVKPNEMLISSLPKDASGEVVPYYDQVRDMAVKYILSFYEPENPVKDDIWFQMDSATYQKVIEDVISAPLMEIGAKLPEGYYHSDGHETKATMGFDYRAHDKGTDGLGELFREKIDESLHRIYYGDELPPEDQLKEDDIWYEFIDDIDGKVCYSDPNTMVIRVDERLIMLEFENDNIQAFAFDDILINFRGSLGVKYLSIIADLMNSGDISKEEISIFYQRLLTFGDVFNLDIRRLYTGTSNIVMLNKIDTTDTSIFYSTNVGRFRMDYSSDEMTNREREAAYRMTIDFSKRDFAFLADRMLVYVNGKYIQRNEYREDYAGRLELLNFHEIIATVDIFYSKKDLHLIALKKLTYQYWQDHDPSQSIQKPSNYDIMVPIKVYDYTKKGYYDILLREYILSGKLPRILNYLEEHKNEAEEFKRDLIRKFHAISDIEVSGMDFDHSKIVIPAIGNTENSPYPIESK